MLRSLRSGHQNKIIAHELGISESTVKVHLRNIMKKLNASNRTQVALVGPLLFDRSGARVRAAVGPRDEFDRGLPVRAQAFRMPKPRRTFARWVSDRLSLRFLSRLRRTARRRPAGDAALPRAQRQSASTPFDVSHCGETSAILIEISPHSSISLSE